MTTLIILTAVIGAAALRAGGIIPRTERVTNEHLPSVRHLPKL
jgi:hypothetical protein